MRECTRVYRGTDWADVATEELSHWLAANPEWSSDRPEGFTGDTKEPEAAAGSEPESGKLQEDEGSADSGTEGASPKTEEGTPPAFEEAPNGGPLVPGDRVFWTKPCGTITSGTLERVEGEHCLVMEDGKKRVKTKTAALKRLK